MDLFTSYYLSDKFDTDFAFGSSLPWYVSKWFVYIKLFSIIQKILDFDVFQWLLKS